MDSERLGQQQEPDALDRLANLLETQARIFAALTQAAAAQTQATTQLMQALVRVMDDEAPVESLEVVDAEGVEP